MDQRSRAVRTERERHAEVGRLLKQAIQCLESLDLSGANEALERANAEAASSRDEAETTVPSRDEAGTTVRADSRTPAARNTFPDAAGRDTASLAQAQGERPEELEQKNTGVPNGQVG